MARSARRRERGAVGDGDAHGAEEGGGPSAHAKHCGARGRQLVRAGPSACVERDGDRVRTDEGRAGRGATVARVSSVRLASCRAIAELGTHSVDARVGGREADEDEGRVPGDYNRDYNSLCILRHYKLAPLR